MHPALRNWRDELAGHFIRALAVACGLAVLSLLAAWIATPPKSSMSAARPSAESRGWIEVERPIPAFALAIPEAADAPRSYAIRRHSEGDGRKDILTVGAPNNAAPHLHVEIYRPGSEISHFTSHIEEIASSARALAPVNVEQSAEPLDSKFGPLSVVTFATGAGIERKCLGFVRTFDDPRLQLSGWFCQGGEAVDRSTLSCALDRLTLLAAGSEPKVGALFARAERDRSFCGQRSPLLAPTPKHRALWQAHRQQAAAN